MDESRSQYDQAGHPPSRWKWVWYLNFTLAYFLLALLSAYLTIDPHKFDAFWLPSGLYVAALLLSPRRRWPWLVAAGMLANVAFGFIHGQPLLVTAGLSAGNTLEALAGAWLVQRWIAPRPTLETLREVVGVLVFSGLLSTVISATIGAAVVVGLIGGGSFGQTWLAYWSGNLMGIMLLAPVLLSWGPRLRAWRWSFHPTPWLNALAIAAAIGLMLWLAIGEVPFAYSPRKFLLIPCVMWAALQFGTPGSALVVLLTGLATAASSGRGLGMPANASQPEQMMLLNLFLATLALTGLITAAVFNERLRKAAELRVSEQRYRDLVESTAVMSWSFDLLADRWTYVSPQAAELFGYPPEDWRDMAWWVARLHPADQRWAPQYCREQTALSQDHAFDYRFMTKDGRTVWVHDVVHVVGGPDGPLALQGVMVDITARKSAETEAQRLYAELQATHEELTAQSEELNATNEELTATNAELRNANAEVAASYEELMDTNAELEQSQTELSELSDRLQAILGSVPDIIMEVDNHKIYTWANQAGHNFFGDDVLGHEAAEYFVEEQTTYQTVQPLFEGQEEIFYVESWQRRKDGEKRLLAWWCRVLKDAQGQVTGALSAATDITERVRAEAALRESEERFRQLAENIDLVFWLTDWKNKKLLYVNPAFERLYGRSCQSAYVNRMNWTEAVHPEDKPWVMALLKEKANLGQLVEVEYRIVRSDSTVRWVLDRSYPIFDDQGNIQRYASMAEDITERKRAEEALRESEERFRNLSVIATEGIAIHEGGVIVDANQAFAQLANLHSADEVIGKYGLEVLPFKPDSRSRILEHLRSGSSETYEIELLRPDGSSLIAETRGEKITYRRRDARLVLMRDITERKRAEQAVAVERDLLHTLMDGIPDPVYFKDAESRFVRINQAQARLLGVTATEDALGKSDFDFFPYSEAEWRRKDEIGIMATGQPLVGKIECISRPDGALQWLSVTKLPRRAEDGEIIGTFGVSRDISEIMNTREALRESEAKYRQLVNTSCEGIWAVDQDSMTTLVNPQMAKMLGYTPENILGRHVREFMFSEDIPPHDEVIQTRLRGESSRYEQRYRRADGSELWCLVSGTPILGDNGQQLGSFGMLADITESKRAESEMRHLEAQLAQAQKMEVVGRLAGGVAHDFNNKLQLILGFSELALDQIPEDSLLTDHLKGIQEAAVGAANLTRQLLAFARQQAIVPVILNLNDTIDGMLKMLRRLIGEEIELVWKPGASLHAVLIDPVQVDQILANLAVNARDAIAGAGRITLETRNVVLDDEYCKIHVECVPGPCVELAVQDTGSGMEADVLAHIFEPFFSTKTTGKGTGLGLSTVYGIVKQNAGLITVDSVLGQGTAFRILFPKAIALDGKDLEDQGPAYLPTGTETILVVEDDPMVMQLASKFLSLQGYNTLLAQSPEECLTLIREYPGPIHLLITDVVMPRMNGRELAKRVQRLMPELRCIFMSGYTAEVISKHGVLERGIEFIQKPFTRTSLALKVRDVLDA